MAEIPLLQQLKNHAEVERRFGDEFVQHLCERAIARIDELEALLTERESTWRAKREEQWKRENPMGSTLIETTPIREDEKVSEAEYQNHLPWCRARRAGYLNRGACNCDVGTSPRARLNPKREEEP